MADIDITQWTDFVRGILDPSREQDLREALETSRKAQRTVKALGRVVDVARKDAEMEIPEHALRVVKAIASIHRPEDQIPQRSRFFSIPFLIRFDSSTHPAPMGARRLCEPENHGPFQRQLAIEAGVFSIDVRLEQELDPHSTTVVGQVVAHDEEIRPMPRVPVLLVSRGRVVGRTRTSPFGEFLAEGLPREPMNLCILVDEKEYIDVPLFEEAGADRLPEE